MTTSDDPLYAEVKQAVTQGKSRIPYREYIHRRAIHYIERVATDDEVADLKLAMLNRIPYSPEYDKKS